MAKSVLIPCSIAADHVGSYVKSGKHATVAVENGHVVLRGAKSTTAGESDVYVTTTPATANLAAGDYYIVYDSPIPTVDSKYKGITDDPREFSIPATKTFSMFKPQVGDEIIITVDGLTGTKSSNTFVVPADGTTLLTWAANASSTSIGFELEGTTFVSIGNTRVVAYKFRCAKA